MPKSKKMTKIKVGIEGHFTRIFEIKVPEKWV